MPPGLGYSRGASSGGGRGILQGSSSLPLGGALGNVQVLQRPIISNVADRVRATRNQQPQSSQARVQPGPGGRGFPQARFGQNFGGRSFDVRGFPGFKGLQDFRGFGGGGFGAGIQRALQQGIPPGFQQRFPQARGILGGARPAFPQAPIQDPINTIQPVFGIPPPFPGGGFGGVQTRPGNIQGLQPQQPRR